MSDSNGSFNRKNSPDIDEYIENEILDYYGEDYIKSIKEFAPPQQPRKRKRRIDKLYPFLTIACAVVFLTGAVITFGVFIGSVVNFQNGEPSESQSSSNVVNPPHSDSESRTVSSSFSDSSSSAVQSESPLAAGDSSNDISSALSSAEPSAASSSESKTGSGFAHTESAETSSHYEQDSSAVSSALDKSSSSSASSAQSRVNTPETASRDREYILPEIPSDGSLASIPSHPDNNSVTNPNGNVITGNPLRAGIGTVLMIMSLAVSLVLNKLRARDE